METALNEITLVLFTTIAPAGVLGYLVMAWDVMTSRDETRINTISRYLVVPLVLAISGLIVSATHLGTPANALYVLAGVGRSPLSNEVVAAVVFLALGGVYWIISFRDDVKRSFRMAWLTATTVAGLMFVGFIAVAYAVPSVPTWNLPTTPVTLWLNGLVSGLVVGLFGLVLAGVLPRCRLTLCLLIGAGVCTLANVVVLAFEYEALTNVITTATRALDLVPWFPAAIAAYGVLECVALALCAAAVLRRPRRRTDPLATVPSAKLIQRRALILVGVAVLVSLAGCFLVRFSFYAMHMTLGV